MIPTDIQTERRNATVLVIDDEEDVRLATVDYLSSVYQFVVDGVDSGETALSLLEKKQYDAIISDYKMKGMSGIDLLKAIRSRGDDTPFLIFTGRGREEVVIAAFENGADGYVMKVVKFDPICRSCPKSDLSRRTARYRKRLWEIQERFKEIYVNSPIAIELYDKTGTLIDVNPACCELFGIHSSDEVRGFTSLMTQTSQQRVFCSSKKVSQSATNLSLTLNWYANKTSMQPQKKGRSMLMSRSPQCMKETIRYLAILYMSLILPTKFWLKSILNLKSAFSTKFYILYQALSLQRIEMGGIPYVMQHLNNILG
jgi:PAS domain S-box-containing protein